MCKTFTWSKSQSDTLKDVVSEMPCFLPSCFIPHPIVNYFINLFLGYPCSGFFFFFLKNICFLFFFLSYLKGKIHSVLYLIFSCLKICPKGQLMLDMESFFILFYRCKACHYIFQLVSNDGYLSCFRFSAVTDKSTVMALCICYFYMWKE